MKTIRRFIAFALPVVLLGMTGQGCDQKITDLIQPVKITQGRTDTLVVGDLFYAKSYDLTFGTNPNIRIDFDRERQTVVFQPAGASGATLVDFMFGGTSYRIPVIVKGGGPSQKPHTFSYRPSAKVKQVMVTGSFNNWTRIYDQLKDSDGNGVYALTLPLDPGNYLYKFVVDGREIPDPANPERTPTGFDDFNSVLRISETDTTRLFLHAGSLIRSNDEVSISFDFETPGDPSPLKRNEVIALLDNQQVDSGNVTVEADSIIIRLMNKELRGNKALRALVFRNGKTTNIQQVTLNEGVPAGHSASSWSWHDGSIYSILIDRFADGDSTNDIPVVQDSLLYQANYQGGDLRGILSKIQEGYFDSLGVNTLWISPVYDNPDIAYREYPAPHRWYSGYHGYWPISETRVEEKFGSMDDLKELVSEAHRRHLKVLLDFIAHHVHIEHPFYQKHPEWFGTLDLPDGRKNLRLWDEQRLTTWFEPYMPSFDFTKSQTALDVVSDNAIWWLKEIGADGFRHDAVKHVPNSFWRTLTRKLRDRIETPRGRSVYQIGETFGDDRLVGSYVNNGQLSAQFNFNLSYSAIPVFLEKERTFATIDFNVKRSFDAFGEHHLMGNIMDSHDKVRYMSYADGDVKHQGVDTREMAWFHPPTVDHPSSYKKAELYYAYLFTTPGLPVIYYGSEFGMTGADDPDNRRMMRFGNQLTDLEKGMLEETSKIVKMRNRHSALRYGDFYTLKADMAVYAYVRSDFNERLLVILNKSEASQEIVLQLPAAYHARTLTDALNGETIGVEENCIRVTIPAIGWRVLKIQ